MDSEYLLKKLSRLDDTLHIRHLIAGLRVIMQHEDEGKVMDLLFLLLKQLDKKNQSSVIENRDSHRIITTILEKSDAPLSVKEAHYLLAGINSVMYMREFNNDYSTNNLNTLVLLRIFGLFSLYSASYAADDKVRFDVKFKYSNSLQQIENELPKVDILSERYSLMQDCLYPLALVAICESITNAKKFSQNKNLILSIQDVIKTNLNAISPSALIEAVNKLNIKIDELSSENRRSRHSEIIRAFENLQEIWSDQNNVVRLKEKVAGMTPESQSTQLVDLIYRSADPAISQIRNTLKEISGENKLTDQTIKVVLEECREIAISRRYINRQATTALAAGAA